MPFPKKNPVQKTEPVTEEPCFRAPEEPEPFEQVPAPKLRRVRHVSFISTVGSSNRTQFSSSEFDIAWGEQPWITVKPNSTKSSEIAYVMIVPLSNVKWISLDPD